MNDDDVRSILSRSLDEGGMGADGGPDQAAIARRVRGSRRRRTAAAAIGSAASVALVAVIAWQAGAFDRDPAPPATPTETATTTEPSTDEPSDDPTGEDPTGEEPSADPTGDPTGDRPAGLPDVSDAVFPTCGEAFTPPGRASELVVEDGPTGPMPDFGGGWATRVTNASEHDVLAGLAMQQMVIVDASGTVVATVDPQSDQFHWPEGGHLLGISAGETLSTTIALNTSCTTGDWLPAGEYEAYALITLVGEGEVYEQAQGGPWPLTIGGGDDTAPDSILPTGTVPVSLDCGTTWPGESPTTGFELTLLDQIRTLRPANDDIAGRAELTMTQPTSAVVYTGVAVLRDGLVVAHSPGTDAVVSVAVTGGVTISLDFGSLLLDCDSSLSGPQQHLPPGEYEVIVAAIARTAQGETVALATTEPVSVSLS